MLSEVKGEFKTIGHDLEVDPTPRLAEIDQALATLHDLARKHRVKPDADGGGSFDALCETVGVMHEVKCKVESVKLKVESVSVGWIWMF